MKVLIDTHSLIWFVDQDHMLTRVAHAAISDPNNELLVSAGSVWEIAIKVAKGKLPLSLPFRSWIDKATADLGFEVLPITVDHAERQTTLPAHHGDPFDRLLAAQALVEGIPLVSCDTIFDAYGVNRIWD